MSFICFLSVLCGLSESSKRLAYHVDSFSMSLYTVAHFVHLEHLLCSTLENMAACKTRYSSGTVSVFTEVKVCFAYF